ncbi:MAG: MFS transporter [Nitrospinae bacterium CG11_big_fil_rev_8_21_14_0_20_56_8]|nr:MAG: MFS transporter [Nitrospinae bacterium CG11_big_fil_rev_8_21_14_0_20_56_8]
MLRSVLALPRVVLLLGVVSFFNDAASDLIYPLVPLYLTSVLMAGPRALGIIEGISEMCGSLLKLFSGAMADKTRTKKNWVVGGYVLPALSRPLLGLVSSWPMALVLRFADRVGKGLRTSPRDALLAAAVAREQRGLAFGFHRAMDHAGAVVGPVVAAGLLAGGMTIREILLWSAAPGALAVMCSLLVREPERLPEPLATRFSWNLRDFSPAFKRYLIVLALFSLGNSSNMFLLLRAREMGLTDSQTPLLWALVSLVAMTCSTHLSALSDRVERTKVIVGGWICYTLFYLFLGLNGGNPAWLWPSFAFYGLFIAATEGAEKALVADLAPSNKLGTAYGWFNVVSGLALLPASLIFGGLWQSFNPISAFGFSSACAALAALLLKFWVVPEIATPPNPS